MLQQQEWMRQQQEAQQAALLQAQQQAQQEEWNRQQQLLLLQQQQQAQQYQQQMAPQQPLLTQPTGFGSNNPFAPSFGQSPPPVPTPSNNGLDSFSLPSTFANSPAPSSSPSVQSPSSISPAPSSGPRPARNDGEHAHLANLLAGRAEDGTDTFGNIGQLRCVASHNRIRVVAVLIAFADTDTLKLVVCWYRRPGRRGQIRLLSNSLSSSTSSRSFPCSV